MFITYKGCKVNILADILSSRVRAEYFKIFFGIHSNEFHLREIERISGFAIGTVRQEAKKLERLELITKRVDGNRTYYKANRNHPLFIALHNLVLQTSGLVDVFKESLNDERIMFAFIFGSLAKGTENTESDIDLFIIGNLGLRDVSKLIKKPANFFKREINPHVMNSTEFKKRIIEKEHFVSNVMNSPKLMIIGNENDLTNLG
jgi:predicted nucleotidyltransferase